MIKRGFDLLLSGAGLIALFPLFILIAILIKSDTPGPVFFRQERVGLHGKLFRIHKFRTMIINASRQGLQITVEEDPRITSVGRKLRKYKIDELPQLIDVLMGHMSLVGPRPEVPFYVAQYPAEIRELILSVRPGITDNAAILFKNENQLLSNVNDANIVYLERILPIKLKLYREYIHNQSFFGDLRLILRTLIAIFR